MAKKPSLPLLGALPARVPTIEAARRRLGGRAAPSPLDGRTVRAGDAAGVVISATDDEVHFLVTGEVVRRAARGEVRVDDAAPIDERVTCDVRVFVGLREQQRVRFQAGADEAPGEGVLFERCRFGALVAKDDGSIVAVGYRRLWPADAPSA